MRHRSKALLAVAAAAAVALLLGGAPEPHRIRSRARAQRSLPLLEEPAPPVVEAPTADPPASAEPRSPRVLVRDAETGAWLADALVVGAPPEIEVRVPGRAPWRVRVAAETAVIQVPPPRVVRGVVVDEDDRPVADARVTWDGKGLRGGEGRTDLDGAFSFEEVPYGKTVRVRAQASGFAPLSESAGSGDRELVLVLEPGARLEGRVFGRRGAPLPDVRVCLLDHMDRLLLATKTDASGRYVLDDVPEGTYLVAAASEDPDLAPARTDVEAMPRAVLLVPDLVLPEAPRLEGEVVDAEGRPVAGATMELRSPLRPATAVSDGFGRFVLPAPPPWPERLRVSHPAHLAPALPLRTDPGRPLRLDLRAGRP